MRIVTIASKTLLAEVVGTSRCPAVPGILLRKIVEGEKAAGDNRGQRPLKRAEGGYGF